MNKNLIITGVLFFASCALGETKDVKLKSQSVKSPTFQSLSTANKQPDFKSQKDFRVPDGNQKFQKVLLGQDGNGGDPNVAVFARLIRELVAYLQNNELVEAGVNRTSIKKVADDLLSSVRFGDTESRIIFTDLRPKDSFGVEKDAVYTLNPLKIFVHRHSWNQMQIANQISLVAMELLGLIDYQIYRYETALAISAGYLNQSKTDALTNSFNSRSQKKAASPIYSGPNHFPYEGVFVAERSGNGEAADCSLNVVNKTQDGSWPSSYLLQYIDSADGYYCSKKGETESIFCHNSDAGGISCANSKVKLLSPTNFIFDNVSYKFAGDITSSIQLIRSEEQFEGYDWSDGNQNARCNLPNGKNVACATISKAFIEQGNYCQKATVSAKVNAMEICKNVAEGQCSVKNVKTVIERYVDSVGGYIGCVATVTLKVN